MTRRMPHLYHRLHLHWYGERAPRADRNQQPKQWDEYIATGRTVTGAGSSRAVCYPI